jgi:hypothetical protein
MASSEDSTIAARKRSVGTAESNGKDWGVVDNGRVSVMTGSGTGRGGTPGDDGSAATPALQPVPVIVLVE